MGQSMKLAKMFIVFANQTVTWLIDGSAKQKLKLDLKVMFSS